MILITITTFGNSAAAPQNPDDVTEVKNVSAFNFVRPGGYRVRVS